MQCPVCAAPNPDGTMQCVKCRALLHNPQSQDTLSEIERDEWASAASSEISVRRNAAGSDDLPPGTVLGERYEILQLLGRGGMGAVYKARDKELDRFVALKLIRSELARNPEILRRFKQELILARQVTHKNVIRIFDLGQAGGVKFITMDFVEGQDLKALLQERGKLPAEEAARIMLQLCRALQAAHSEGVIHRDLKPQNIMLDANGRVYVMDFGIARSAYLPGMTQTGALIGTPDYMSPEQARGEKLDERSDIFSMGVIFYEIVTGRAPYPSDTPLATLWKRMQEPVTPPIQLEPTLPAPVNAIIVKALEIEAEKRLASTGDMAQQLEIWLGPSAGGSTIYLPSPRTAAYWKWASVALGVLLISAVFIFRRTGTPKAAPAHKAVSVLVADFTNGTGDEIFDETLEPPLSVALEDASFITVFSRNQARKIAAQVKPGGTSLDEDVARLVGNREGIEFVVSGAIEKKGSGYELRAKTVEVASGKNVLEVTETSGDKKGVLHVVDTVAARTRRALGDATPESAQLSAAGTFTTSSLEAAHAYALAQDLQWAGKFEEAIPLYEQAVKFDENLGRAYAGLASTSANLGRRKDAEKYYQLALAHMDRMSDREKYRTRGGYYLANREPHKAIEEYSALVQQFPTDGAGYTNLALAYFYQRDMAKALQVGHQAVELLPKEPLQLDNLALYAVYAGDFSTAAANARKVIQQNSSFALAYNALAMAQAGQGQFAEADQTYHKLEGISARGAQIALMGHVDLLLYQGRIKDALAMLQKSAPAASGKTDEDALAAYYILSAQAKLAAGKSAEAAADAKSALAHDQGEITQFASGRIYVEAGQFAPVQPLIVALSARLDLDGQAYGKILDGEQSLKHGEAKKAIKLFTDAQTLSDTWLGRLDLGRAYVEDRAFPEADSEFELCLKRRGEASAIYLDDVPTLRELPPVTYYLARAQEGMKSPSASDTYKAFLAVKEKGDEAGLVKDTERRLAAHWHGFMNRASHLN